MKDSKIKDAMFAIHGDHMHLMGLDEDGTTTKDVMPLSPEMQTKFRKLIAEAIREYIVADLAMSALRSLPTNNPQ